MEQSAAAPPPCGGPGEGMGSPPTASVPAIGEQPPDVNQRYSLLSVSPQKLENSLNMMRLSGKDREHPELYEKLSRMLPLLRQLLQESQNGNKSDLPQRQNLSQLLPWEASQLRAQMLALQLLSRGQPLTVEVLSRSLGPMTSPLQNITEVCLSCPFWRPYCAAQYLGRVVGCEVFFYASRATDPVRSGHRARPQNNQPSRKPYS